MNGFSSWVEYVEKLSLSQKFATYVCHSLAIFLYITERKTSTILIIEWNRKCALWLCARVTQNGYSLSIHSTVHIYQKPYTITKSVYSIYAPKMSIRQINRMSGLDLFAHMRIYILCKCFCLYFSIVIPIVLVVDFSLAVVGQRGLLHVVRVHVYLSGLTLNIVLTIYIMKWIFHQLRSQKLFISIYKISFYYLSIVYFHPLDCFYAYDFYLIWFQFQWFISLGFRFIFHSGKVKIFLMYDDPSSLSFTHIHLYSFLVNGIYFKSKTGKTWFKWFVCFSRISKITQK